MKAAGFHYEFVPGRSERTLLLLHGTGGDEHDLLPLGRALNETASLLAPRGQISENGANRFFRRIAEGVFDEADVIFRAQQLADFIETVASEYQLDPLATTAVGYSNGANIASALLLLGLAKIAGAVLFRPMPPLSNPPAANLRATRVLISAGAFDPIATPEQVKTVAHLLRARGAEVNTVVQQSGHELTRADLESARDWLAASVIA